MNESLSAEAMLAKMKHREPKQPIAAKMSEPVLPFDPIERSQAVEAIVMKGNARSCSRFRHANFYGPSGIVTVDAVGCNLLCAYCWMYAKNANPCNQGAFYAPSKVVARLESISNAKGCDQFRMSGSEPFLGLKSANHLAEVIKLLDGRWVIETNGLMLGHQPEILNLFDGMNVFWRITVKGSDPETFQKVTGAKGEFYELPIAAIRALKQSGYRYQVAFNPSFVNEHALNLPYNADIEHERMRSYAGVAARMDARGLAGKRHIATYQNARVVTSCRAVAPCISSEKEENDRWA
jgi:uncharacterized Fe-S cluster-containing radical SAM superfamily protein